MTFGRTLTERREEREAERERNLRSLCIPSKAIGKGVYTGSTAGAAPKTEPKRNRALLDMAKGRPCLVGVPLLCEDERETVVAAHSNRSEHGKAGARKADDQYSAWACWRCHHFIDQGAAPGRMKDAFWDIGHRAQVREWQRIAADPAEPARFRKAAQWALDQLAG